VENKITIKDNEDIRAVKEHVYLIKKGVRNCAWLECTLGTYDEICKIIEEENLMHYEDEIDTDDFLGVVKRIFVYRYPHQLKMFKSCMPYPNTYEKHYILGKLFGYSNEAIEDFLSNNVKQHEQIFSKNIDIRDIVKQFFDKRFNKETFTDFLDNQDEKYDDVHEFFFKNIYSRIQWDDFVAFMKVCYFDKYIIS